MRHLCSFLRLLIVTAVLGLATLGQAKPAEAAVEFRYGNLSWKKVGPRTAEFILTCGFRRSGYPGRSPDGFVGVGDRLTDAPQGIILNFDDDTTPAGTTPVGPRFNPASGPSGTGLDFVVVAIDPRSDLVIARAVDPASGQDRIRFTYPAPVDDSDTDLGKPWIASIGQNFNSVGGATSARPAGLGNNSAAQDQAATLRNFRLEAAVDLASNTNSVATSMPSMFTVTQGSSFFIPAFDADGHTLRYRLAGTDFAIPFEGGTLFTQPPGVTIDPLTGEYTVPAGLAPGPWATQVVIEEYGSTGTLVGRVAVDFIFNVRTTLPGAAPQFRMPPTPGNGAILTAVVGRPLTYLVQASDPNGQPVTINSTGAPSGARQVAALPTTAGLVQSLFSWTPTLANLGAHSIVYTARDTSDNVTQTAVTIVVVQGIDLTEPDGGEMYTVDQKVGIRWISGGGVRAAGVKIEISRDGGATWDPTPIVALTSDTGQYTWTVTGPFTKRGRIRVSNVADPTDYGISDKDFTIADGHPSGPICSAPGATPIPDNTPSWTEVPLDFAEDLIIRSVDVSVDIAHPFIGDLEVAVVHPDGTVVLLHDETGEGQANLTTTFGYGFRNGTQLTVPVESLTSLYGKRSVGTWKLRVRDLNPGDVGQVNQWCLSMIGRDTGKITVTAPTVSERWAVSTTHPITWSQMGVVGDVNVQISRDGGINWTTVAAVPVTNLSFDWLVTGPETTQARVRVVSVDDPVQLDNMDGDFTIQNPYFKILAPAKGESIPVGRPYQIRWDGLPLGAGEDVKIEYTNDGATWQVLAGAASNTGLFTWTPTVAQATVDPTAFKSRIRITANQAPARVAETDDFRVQNPTIAVLAPAQGDKWYIETTHTIRWSNVGVTGPVNVEVSRDNGTTWELIGIGLPNSQPENTLDWKVTGPESSTASDTAQVRVTSVDDPTKFGISLPFSIREMRVKVTSPNGGEVFGVGSTQTITWDKTEILGNVDISLIKVDSVNGNQEIPLFTDVKNEGTQDWVVGNTVGAKWLIRVKAHDYLAADESDAVFTIVQPTLSVISPVGGEELRVGKSATLKWASSGVSGQVRLELSRNGGSTWETLFAATENDGTEQWNPVTGPDTSNALFRVTSLNNSAVTAQSAGAFSVVTPTVTLTAPNGGQRWFTGTGELITWNAKGFDGPVKIDVTRNGGQSWDTVFAQTENDGVQEWLVSGDNASSARIRITSVNDSTITDQSDGPFSITAPTITLGTPNGGQTWLLGSTQTVTWRTVGVTGNVDIELSLDGGTTWKPLATNTTDDGSEAWTVEGPGSTSAKIRVKSHSRPEIRDTSDNSFTIAGASLQVTSPTTGSKWHKGSQETITWTGSALAGGGTVDILLSRNGGKSYQTIIKDTANDGSASWTVTGSTANKCRVKVVWNGQSGVSGVSNGNFAIAGKLKVKNR